MKNNKYMLHGYAKYTIIMHKNTTKKAEEAL